MNSGINTVINEQTKISALIKANPLVIETLVEFNPHFSKLRNPILRKLLAGRVSISDACRIGGCQINDFLDKMAGIGFEINRTVSAAEAIALSDPEAAATKAAFYDKLEMIELDVRPILAQKLDPLKLIIRKADALKPGQGLKVINTFEPSPLINLLGKKGFQYHTERPDPETVITFFAKTSAEQTGKTIHDDLIPHNTNGEFESRVLSFMPDKLHTADVRDLEMPFPMITILEHLKKLQPDEALFVYHKKVPVLLLSELEERGFKYLLQSTPDRKVNMLICKL